MKNLAPCLALLALAGCIDLEQEVTLNPDGSGKVAVHWVASPMEMGTAKGPDARAKDLLKDEVTKCEGVDIESIVVKDAAGNVVKTNETGWSSSNNETTRTLSTKGKFPAKGRIIVKVYDDLKSYEIPFKIVDVDLLGRPLK